LKIPRLQLTEAKEPYGPGSLKDPWEHAKTGILKGRKKEPEPDNARATMNITTVAQIHIAKGMAMISTIIPTGYPPEKRNSTMDPMKPASTTNRKGINRFFHS
jgi:hypothetical protein